MKFSIYLNRHVFVMFILQGSEYSAFLHDVVYLYMLILNETLYEGGDYRNGTEMFERAKGKIFRGNDLCLYFKIYKRRYPGNGTIKAQPSRGIKRMRDEE